MIITLASLLAGALTVAVVLLCWPHYRKPADAWIDWPAQVSPFYCEGLHHYGRNHCGDAGLHQCGACHKEQRLNGIMGATNDRHSRD